MREVKGKPRGRIMAEARSRVKDKIGKISQGDFMEELGVCLQKLLIFGVPVRN